MPACWAMVRKTSLLLRGFAEAPTLSGLSRTSFETGRADAFFTAFFAMFVPPLLLAWASPHRLGTGQRQARPAAWPARAARPTQVTPHRPWRRQSARRAADGVAAAPPTSEGREDERQRGERPCPATAAGHEPGEVRRGDRGELLDREPVGERTPSAEPA